METLIVLQVSVGNFNFFASLGLGWMFKKAPAGSGLRDF